MHAGRLSANRGIHVIFRYKRLIYFGGYRRFTTSLAIASKGNVRLQLIQFGATFILTLCIWGHVSEIFDRWDNTLQTGYDIEYSTVIVALSAGAVFWLARVAAKAIRARSATSCLSLLFAAYPAVAPNPAAFVAQSPPPHLRI